MRYRVPDRRWLFGLFAVAIGGWASSPSAPAAASEPVERQEEYAASSLAVSGPVGSLHVEGHDRADIRLVLRGSPEAIERLRREVRSDRLELTAEPAPNSVTTVISGRNNIVIATPGARATQIIGGVATTIVDVPPERPLEVQVYVPQNAPMIVEGMVGEFSVEGVDGSVELELVGGAARLDRVAGGRLSVVGGGRIQAAEATGDLSIDVQGAGDVRIDRAKLGQLKIGLSGTGNVSVSGSAEQASVAMAGVGGVQIDEVRERPQVSVAGIGRVKIGNW